jgi:hypothetical protein
MIVSTTWRNDTRLWLWAPAFAGATDYTSSVTVTGT